MSSGRWPPRIGVVVPARDEQALLPRCLSHLLQAGTRLRSDIPGAQLRVVVALDSCHDESAAVVLAHPAVESVRLQAHCVGAARAAGCDRLLVGHDPVDWVAMTDADSIVPERWLVAQAEALRDGLDLLLGTVLPDTDLAPAPRSRWEAQHRLVDGHPHIHGANMGISAAAYRAVGGFRPLPEDEDVDLARRVQATGRRWLASATNPVVTSTRSTNRVPSGFAGYLRDHVLGPGCDAAEAGA